MKKLCLLIVCLLFSFPVMSQDADTDALLLITRYDQESNTQKLYVLNADTGEDRVITESVVDAGWSPDGRVWVVDDLKTERRLRFFDLASGEESTFGESLYLDNCFSSLLWSPSGEQLAFFTGTDDERVLRLEISGEISSFQIPVAMFTMLRWSPDERYVILNEPIMSSPYRLLAIADGSVLLDKFTDPVFSPDSRYLSYVDEDGVVQRYELATGEISAVDPAEQTTAAAPIRSPDGIHDVYLSENGFSFSHAGSDNLTSVEFESRIGYVGWRSDASTILLYSDYVDYSGDERPTTLLSYDLASGESTTILTDVGGIRRVLRSGDWIVVFYTAIPNPDRFPPTTHLLAVRGEDHTEAEISVPVDDMFGPYITSLGDEGGLLVAAFDGLYHFDSQSGNLDAVHLGNTSRSYRSAEGDYAAFVTYDEQRMGNHLTIWDVQREAITQTFPPGRIIGWRGRGGESLLYCGIG